MDDFVISAFLSSGSSTDTVPVRIYSNARGSPTPALNALASLTLFFTLLASGLGFLVWRIVRGRSGARGSVVTDFARLQA
jgi:spermidine/putrescine transport system permease protein